MLPITVATIIIGEKVPPIVDYCLSHNDELCNSHNVRFKKIIVERDFNFNCPGTQAEFLKLEHLLTYNKIMMIDWDIQLLEIPDIEDSEYPYFARNKNRNDLFLSYCSTEESKKIISNILDSFNLHRSGYRAVNEYLDFTKEISFNYLHYHTRLGFGSVPVSYSDFSEEYRKKLDEKCKLRNKERFKIWPVYL